MTRPVVLALDVACDLNKDVFAYSCRLAEEVQVFQEWGGGCSQVG